MPDNRSADRLRLPTPLEATAGTIAVLLIDVSRTGFKVHHQERLPPRFTLRFRGAAVECSTVWTAALRPPTLSSGLRIEKLDATSERAIAALLSPDPYLFCELVNGAWRHHPTSRRDHQGDGFTLSSAEDRTHVDRLCAAYASGDAETRKLIRTLAALSIKSSGEGAGAR